MDKRGLESAKSAFLFLLCGLLAAFALTARDEVDMDALTAALLGVVDETMQPERLSLPKGNRMTQLTSTESYIPTRWLTPLKLLWFACAIILFAGYFAGLGPRFDELATLCHSRECASLTLTPQELSILQGYGMDITAFAWAEIGLEGFLVVIFSALAGLLFWRRSDTWVGYTLSLAFLFLALPFFAEELRSLARVLPALRPLNDAITSLSIILVLLVFYIFPDGRFVPGWVRWLVAGLVMGLTLDPLLNQGGVQASSSTLLAIILFLIGACVGLFSQIYRFRRVATAAQRQQTKWVLFGFLSMFAGMLPWAIFAEIAPLPPGEARLLFYASLVPQYLLIGLFPASVTISILRYRLWDIDILIRKTLLYAALSALLALVYFGTILVLQSAFRTVADVQSPLVIVASTLLIAALFTPLRRRMQEVIDRRFFRQKYDAQQVLAAFAVTARDETDLDELMWELQRVVEGTMQPEGVGVWLKKP